MSRFSLFYGQTPIPKFQNYALDIRLITKDPGGGVSVKLASERLVEFNIYMNMQMRF